MKKITISFKEKSKTIDNEKSISAVVNWEELLPYIGNCVNKSSSEEITEIIISEKKIEVIMIPKY